MSSIQNTSVEKNETEQQQTPLSFIRRDFLKFAGVGAVDVLFATSGCKIHSKVGGRLNPGKGDFSVLNYAYALEQMEAAFYEKVISNFYTGATEMEKYFLTDIRNDEIAHREFFREVLFLKKLTKLEFDFSTVNFNNRSSVLNTAKEWEDTGVSAYNGAGKLLDVRLFLKEAGKIVSVEARHAATIRNMISYGDFAGDDIINADGLDVVQTPAQVLAKADKYFKTKITVQYLPTT